jgi:hypothetical protein
VRRLVTILRREAAAGVSAALLHIADACCAAGVAIPSAGKEPRNFGLHRVKQLAQPAWAPGIVLFGLAVLLFPDGRPPSWPLRRMVWVYGAVAVCWFAAAAAITVSAITGHRIQVDPSGNLLFLDDSIHSPTWWIVLSNVFFGLFLAKAGLDVSNPTIEDR